MVDSISLYFLHFHHKLFYHRTKHHNGNVISDNIVLRKTIPVAYFSSPPYFAESNAVVIGAGIPAMITVIPRSIPSIGRNAVIANTTAGITSSLIAV